jgi:hypothetical protein
MRNHLFHDPELEEMARVAADLGATMMPFTTLTEKALLGYELGDTSPSIPGTHYVGLLAAASWAGTTAYSSGAYIIGSAFASTNRHIYKCTTGGTSGGSEPTWNQTVGGTTTDGTVTWTEVTALFAAGTTTGAEPASGAYARVSVTNNTTNWPTPTGGDPATVSNGTAITFPTTTGSWGQLVGFGLWDASTAGNLRTWGLLTGASLVATSAGVTPSFSATNLSATLL